MSVEGGPLFLARGLGLLDQGARIVRVLASVADRRVHHRLDLRARQIARKRKVGGNGNPGRVKAFANGAADQPPWDMQPGQVAKAELFLAEQLLVDARLVR